MEVANTATGPKFGRTAHISPHRGGGQSAPQRGFRAGTAQIGRHRGAEYPRFFTYLSLEAVKASGCSDCEARFPRGDRAFSCACRTTAPHVLLPQRPSWLRLRAHAPASLASAAEASPQKKPDQYGQAFRHLALLQKAYQMRERSAWARTILLPSLQPKAS